MDLEWTGERVVPDKMNPNNGMLLEHIARYEFSLHFARGRVVDIACGAGYGTQMLAQLPHIEEVVGVDLSAQAIEYAQKHYYHSKLNYQQGDVTDPQLPEQLGAFDTVVSFETMEHVEEEKLYLENMYKFAKPGGTIIISTPFGRGRGKPCKDPYHVHQLTVEEFETAVTEFFGPENLSIYHQRDTAIEFPIPEKKYYLGVAVIDRPEGSYI